MSPLYLIMKRLKNSKPLKSEYLGLCTVAEMDVEGWLKCISNTSWTFPQVALSCKTNKDLDNQSLRRRLLFLFHYTPSATDCSWCIRPSCDNNLKQGRLRQVADSATWRYFTRTSFSRRHIRRDIICKHDVTNIRHAHCGLKGPVCKK